MDLAGLRRIKQLAIIAMFSDDEFMEILILKGGNALDIIYGISGRASVDLDFSLSEDFTDGQKKNITSKIETLLRSTFRPEGFEPFDIKFEEKPKPSRLKSGDPEMAFWGGYSVEFKILHTESHPEIAGDLIEMRKYAAVLGKKNSTKFSIDISKFEYCDQKRELDLDGYTIYVYSPEMIVCEKLRAICQQMPEYAVIVNSSSQSARARDFFDIHSIVSHYNINIATEENLSLIEATFAAKRVPLNLIGRINRFREYHREGFVSLEATVYAATDLKGFDFYFDYVIDLCDKLETLWKK